MLHILIMGAKWKAFFVEEEKYIRTWGDDTEAHTLPSKKELYFNNAEITRKTIIHELCHAHYEEMCVGSASLTKNQQEEVFCELFSEHGDKILRLARRLYKEFKEETN